MDTQLGKRGGETAAHQRLKRRTLLWAQAQGFSACGVEVSLPRCRYRADVAAYRRDEGLELPESFDYVQMTALSMEVRQKLQSIRPRTIGQAGRIDGITPAALTLLVAHVRRERRERQTAS